MTRLRLYRNDFDRAVLGVTIELDRKGKVSLKPGKDHVAAEEAMRLLQPGVPILRGPLPASGRPRIVTPEDGREYLDEVERMLRGRTRWVVERED